MTDRQRTDGHNGDADFPEGCAGTLYIYELRKTDNLATF